ncbi:MAG: alpha amylase C-terminal domain-containing protein [Chloroflexi bacterium]|nr:alpha amylase C-terminal domain-containing protein [Chloroflexota bacterium]
MGAIPVEGGVTFRVWAPHATAVAVHGTFDEWAADGIPMAAEEGGTWSADVPGAAPGDEYRFLIDTGTERLSRIDPRARRLTTSVGNAIVYDAAAFDWGDQHFDPPHWDDLVIYELHVGTFSPGMHGRPGTLDGVRRRLPYLRELGVGAIQLMPPFEFAGDRSWGYNPAFPFAVESTYGGPDELKALVKAAHEHGIAVLLDVVYNHLGPSDLDLWQFDGWSEGDQGGIYFYQDERSSTPWGDTRPDYGRAEVRAFLRDNAIQWLDEFRVDGLRWDATAYISSITGGGRTATDAIPDGWQLMADINAEIAERFPGRLTIAEDLRADVLVTTSPAAGGAGFGAQWDGGFVHAVRGILTAVSDEERDVASLVPILAPDPTIALERVIYTESHDEDANGSARVPEEIWPGYADSWPSRKRATLGAAIVLTSPGIPMLFQGQELIEGSWFSDEDPVDWSLRRTHAGLLRLHADLIGLRRNQSGVTAGLRGRTATVHHVDLDAKVLAWHRWESGGPRDDVIVVASFATEPRTGLRIGVPRAGRWRVRFNADWDGYDPEFQTIDALDVDSEPVAWDGMAQRIVLDLGPYSVLVLSQDD